MEEFVMFSAENQKLPIYFYAPKDEPGKEGKERNIPSSIALLFIVIWNYTKC